MNRQLPAWPSAAKRTSARLTGPDSKDYLMMKVAQQAVSSRKNMEMPARMYVTLPCGCAAPVTMLLMFSVSEPGQRPQPGVSCTSPTCSLRAFKWPCSLTYVARECALREYPCGDPKPTCHCQDLLLLGSPPGHAWAGGPDKPRLTEERYKSERPEVDFC